MRPAFFPLFAFRLTVVAGIIAVTLSSARAYLLLGNSWASGTIPMRLQLDTTRPTSVAFPLLDGSTSWNTMVASIFADWNANLGRTQFTSSQSTSTSTAFGDNINSVLFSTTVNDDDFGVGVLAVTIYRDTPVRKSESDVIVNKAAFTWNSYRGALRSGVFDLRRVLLHEFGHVLGLDHPDQDSPAQSVTAIMNSRVSNLETLQLDDVNGAAFLYSTPIIKPSVALLSGNQTVNVTDSLTLSATVNGQSSVTNDALHGYSWWYAPAANIEFQQMVPRQDSPQLKIPLAQLTDTGRYYFSAVTPDDIVNSDILTLAVNPVALSTTTQLVNVATRGVAGSGANSMIVGFVVTGSKPKKVLLRAIGPTLGSFDVPGTLADPILSLKTDIGVDLATNNNWEQPLTATDASAADIRTAFARVGAFALAGGSKDAVLLITLAPGKYTALVSSPTSASGVVLLEAYDADDPLDPAIKLANLSTRGFVGTGGDIIIAGFVVKGPGPKTYLIRAVGDSLKDYGVTGTLDDPYLKLFRGDGTLLRETDDWDLPATTQPSLQAAFEKVGAFPLTDRQESVMLVTLPPDRYSAQMSGFDGGTGVALIEVYEVPN